MNDMKDIIEIPQKCPQCHRNTKINWINITYELIPESFVILKGFWRVPYIIRCVLRMRKATKESFNKVMKDKAMQVTAMTGGKVYFCVKCGFYAGYGGNEEAISFVAK